MEFLQTVSGVLGMLVGLCYLYQILYLLVPLFRRPRPHAPEKQNRYAVLIAARNEEQVLPHLLQSLKDQDYPPELVDVFVVADNCTDGTAQAAGQMGAAVYTRFNNRLVGKGYALRDLLAYIEVTKGLDSYDAFLVFDADNLLEPDYISAINRVCSDGYSAFCGYRNSKNYGDSWLSSGCSLMYLHESTHLNRSRMLLGTGCCVSGTGFGFTRQLLQDMDGWNFFTLTEDLEFNTWCATHGIVIGYCHDAILYDEQAEAFRQSCAQRTRWAQGGYQVSLKYARELGRGILSGGLTGWMSFETATLSLWGYGAAFLSSGLSLLLTACTQGPWDLLYSALFSYLSLFAIGALTLASEWKRIKARPAVKLQSLFTFPLFLLTSVPIGLTAIFRKRQWKPIRHTAAISLRQLES